MSVLAINGGEKIRYKNFPAYSLFDEHEKEACIRVLDSHILSRYLGCWSEDFYGGDEVQAFEKEWAQYFGVKHAIAVNSATSGLCCAVGAAEVGLGDEVIVSPYTMSASAVAPLIYNAVPVFADIEEDYFCLSPESIESRITEYTKAIIVVDIFGQPYDRDAINAIAKKHDLLVIEDAAQAPGAMYKGKFAGTLGDIGVFSLNYHKHIHTGEGGVIVTDDDVLADKMKLIRNHAEAIIDSKGNSDYPNMLGFNFRLTEMQAAMGREQLKKLDDLLAKRNINIKYLCEALNDIPCISPAKVRDDCEHAFYLHPFTYDKSKANGIDRDLFINAVKAELAPTELRLKEGVKLGAGYVKPLYLQSIYQNRSVYGKSGFPWTSAEYKGNVSYAEGLCLVCEKMHFEELFYHELFHSSMTKEDLDDVVAAFIKVYSNRMELV